MRDVKWRNGLLTGLCSEQFLQRSRRSNSAPSVQNNYRMKTNSNSEFKSSKFQIVWSNKAGLILLNLLKDAINMGTHDKASASWHGFCTKKEHILLQSKHPYSTMLSVPLLISIPLLQPFLTCPLKILFIKNMPPLPTVFYRIVSPLPVLNGNQAPLWGQCFSYSSIQVNPDILPHALHYRAIKLGEGQEILQFNGEYDQLSIKYLLFGDLIGSQMQCVEWVLPLKYKHVLTILFKFFSGSLCLEDKTQVP